MSDTLADLSREGVSIWLDDLSRKRLVNGTLADLAAHDHVVGVTTNPTIFAKATRAQVLRRRRTRWRWTATFVIVGAGLAGAKAAETLRDEGFGGPVVLIGDETERPYERPPLSKDYLLGKAPRETIFVHPRPGTASMTSTCALACRSPASTPRRTRCRSPTAAGSGTPSCYWPRGLRHGACRSRAATWTACFTCAGSPTATRSRPRSRPRRGSW